MQGAHRKGILVDKIISEYDAVAQSLYKCRRHRNAINTARDKLVF
jgi:hypothetical protein